ncbi:MAG: DMT family transporter [Euryarchaeota archaeon]|nr:DMT family transporter [Euryarchaeota archaeon]
MGVSQNRTLVRFLLVSVFFGGTFVAAKAGQASVPPLLLVAVRFDIAAVILMGYVALTRSRAELLPKTTGDIAAILAAGVLAIGLANGLLFVGQGSLTSGVGAILFALVPIFAPLFAGALLADERLTAAGAVGTLVGLVGVGMVVDITPATVIETVSGGAVIVLAGAVSLALGTVLIRRADSSLSSTVRTAWALPVSALMLHALSIGAGESTAAAEWTLGAIVAVGYLGVFAGAVAYILYFGLLDEVGATQSSLVFYASPIVATLGGWLLLGEALTATTIAGFAVVLVGFGIIGHESLAPVVRRAVGRVDRQQWPDTPGN